MKALLGAGAVSCVVAVVILFVSWTAYFSELNCIAYDFTLRLAGPVPVTSPTLIVGIDEESLRREGGWPWSREKLARILDRLNAANPLTIGLDILLDDSTSPDADSSLAAAIARTRAPVLAAHLDGAADREHWRWPHPLFLQKHVRLGHVHTDPDVLDNINRRILSVKAAADGRPLRAFAVEVLHSARLPFHASFEQKSGAADVLRPGPINIRFVGDNNSFPHVPAWQLLDGSADLGRFANRIVLIGLTAQGLDQWFTPFAQTGKKMSGVEIHANAIETLYAGRAINEVAEAYLFAALMLFVFFLWGLDRRFEGRGFYVSALLTGPAALAVSWGLLKYAGLWLPFPPFWAAVVVVLPGLEVAKVVRVNRDLDRKIERLSSSWLQALRSYELGPPQSLEGAEARTQFISRRGRSSRWKLDTIDFLNAELMRFLSFNNAILASIEDVILVCDRDGHVVYQNPAARRLAGYRENPGSVSGYLSFLLDGRRFDLEPGILHSVPGRDGKTFYNLTVAPISTAGAVFSLHDVTAQHELSQAKSEMVSLVSHELRTPLTSIRGYSEMLLKYGLVGERGRDFLTTIIDESTRLNQLIQSFLDIAYIESGRQKIVRSEFEIAPLVADMIHVIHPVAAEKQISLEGPDGLNGMRVRADRLLLCQALTNLVTNAVKYSPAGTTVRIGVANGNGTVRFQVADQGYGIPAGEVSKIFEKFYRRPNKETREQSGFGLGLAFVKEVAIRHGGDVTVQSEPGRGSVFTLWIPA